MMNARGTVAFDANALDGEAARQGEVADRLRRHIAAGTLRIAVTAGVRAEVMRPETPIAVRDALLPHAVPPPSRPPTHEQTMSRIRVRAILRGDTGGDRHEADARNLSEAAEAGCAGFVTNDRRILRRRADLRAVLPALRIMTPEALLAALEDGEDGSAA